MPKKAPVETGTRLTWRHDVDNAPTSKKLMCAMATDDKSSTQLDFLERRENGHYYTRKAPVLRMTDKVYAWCVMEAPAYAKPQPTPKAKPKDPLDNYVDVPVTGDLGGGWTIDNVVKHAEHGPEEDPATHIAREALHDGTIWVMEGEIVVGNLTPYLGNNCPTWTEPYVYRERVLHYHAESDCYFIDDRFDVGDGLVADVTDNPEHEAEYAKRNSGWTTGLTS